MTVSPLDSALLGPYLSDPETARRFSDAARLRGLARVEEALARACEREGLAPPGAARAVARAAAKVARNPARVGAGAAAAGIAVPAYVALLREAAGTKWAPHVHRGATSQDIDDTAFVLCAADALDSFGERLGRIARRLADLARLHRGTVMAGRTRARQAVPVTFGLRAASWRAPLVRHLERLAELRARLLVVQLGGAGGTLDAFGSRGIRVMERLARELGLGAPPLPWHAQRDGPAELAGWLSMVTGSLGKMGQDLVLLAQTEVDEVRPGPGGRSSSMPQKENPTGPEALVALARMNAALLAAAHQALVHGHERSGAALALEWLALPQMAVCTGAALRHAEALARTMRPDPARMRANLEAAAGTVLAGAARDALAADMPREEADALVRAAAARARRKGTHLLDALAAAGAPEARLAPLRDPLAAAGAAGALVDRALRAGPRPPRRRVARGPGRG